MIAHRLIIDTIRRQGGPEYVPITKGLLESCAQPRRRYQLVMEAVKLNSKEASKKKEATDILSEMQNQEKHLRSDIAMLRSSADSKALEADDKRDWSLLTESNALKGTAKNKGS